MNLLKTCPECGAGPDPLYGWDPITKVGAFGAPVIKEQCWGCGYHRAYFYEMSTDDQLRATTVLAQWLWNAWFASDNDRKAPNSTLITDPRQINLEDIEKEERL